MEEGQNEIFFAPPPPLSFLLPITLPLGRTSFLFPVFHCMKNSRWRPNFLRCERSLDEISPALQATEKAGGKRVAVWENKKCCGGVLVFLSSPKHSSALVCVARKPDRPKKVCSISFKKPTLRVRERN